MRHILRKIKQNQPLENGEKQQLYLYIEHLRHESRESYQLFYDRYSRLLYVNYQICLPPQGDDLFELVHYLLETACHDKPGEDKTSGSEVTIPWHYSARDLFKDESARNLYTLARSYLQEKNINTKVLPRPRQHKPVFKYEVANPSKETGLKQHFERIARFTFVSRLQSYRYLSGNKANRDRIDYFSPDTLKGIFTNKEKSIYFYIYLSESHREKARNACELLNFSLYNLKSTGESNETLSRGI